MEFDQKASREQDRERSRETDRGNADRKEEVRRALRPARGRHTSIELDLGGEKVPLDPNNKSLHHRLNINRPMDLQTPAAHPGDSREARAMTIRGGARVPSMTEIPGPATDRALDLTERDQVRRQVELARVDPKFATAAQAKDLGSAFVHNRVLDAGLERGADQGMAVLADMRSRLVQLQTREGRYPRLERMEAMGIAAPGASVALPQDVHQPYVDGIIGALGNRKDQGVIPAQEALERNSVSTALEQIRLHGGASAVLGRVKIQPVLGGNTSRLESQLGSVGEGLPVEKRREEADRILRAMEMARERVHNANLLRGVTAEHAVLETAIALRGGQTPKGPIRFSGPNYERLLQAAEQGRNQSVQKAVQGDFQKLQPYLTARSEAMAHASRGEMEPASQSLDKALSHWAQTQATVRPEVLTSLRTQGFGPASVLESVRGVSPSVLQEAWGMARLNRLDKAIPAGTQDMRQYLYRQPGRPFGEYQPLASYQQSGVPHLAFEDDRGRPNIATMETMTSDPRHPGHILASRFQGAVMSSAGTKNPVNTLRRDGFVSMLAPADTYRPVSLKVHHA